MIKSVALRAMDSANSSLIIMPVVSFMILFTVPVGRTVFLLDKTITKRSKEREIKRQQRRGKNAQETKQHTKLIIQSKERSRIQGEPLNAPTLGKPTPWSSASSARGEILETFLGNFEFLSCGFFPKFVL